MTEEGASRLIYEGCVVRLYYCLRTLPAHWYVHMHARARKLDSPHCFKWLKNTNVFLNAMIRTFDDQPFMRNIMTDIPFLLRCTEELDMPIRVLPAAPMATTGYWGNLKEVCERSFRSVKQHLVFLGMFPLANAFSQMGDVFVIHLLKQIDGELWSGSEQYEYQVMLRANLGASDYLKSNPGIWPDTLQGQLADYCEYFRNVPVDEGFVAMFDRLIVDTCRAQGLTNAIWPDSPPPTVKDAKEKKTYIFDPNDVVMNLKLKRLVKNRHPICTMILEDEFLFVLECAKRKHEHSSSSHYKHGMLTKPGLEVNKIVSGTRLKALSVYRRIKNKAAQEARKAGDYSKLLVLIKRRERYFIFTGRTTTYAPSQLPTDPDVIRNNGCDELYGRKGKKKNRQK